MTAGSTIGPWTVGLGGVDLQGSRAGANPNQSVDLSEVNPGSIAQSIRTTPGTAYTVSFGAAANTAGAPAVKTMTVSADSNGAVLQSYNVTKPGGDWCESASANTGYDSFSYSFVATSPSTKLTFTSTTNSRFGPIVDNVDVLPAGATAVAATGSCTTWSPGADFQTSPQPANPSPDRCGTPDVWSYSFASATDVSSGQLLSTFQQISSGDLLGLVRWFDGQSATGGVYFNPTSQPITAADPPQHFQVNPDGQRAVVVRWHSSVEQTVTVGGAIVDRDKSCGDGVVWSVLLNSSKIAGGRLANGATQALGGDGLSSIKASAGATIDFVVAPGTDSACDTTGLDVTISSV